MWLVDGVFWPVGRISLLFSSLLLLRMKSHLKAERDIGETGEIHIKTTVSYYFKNNDYYEKKLSMTMLVYMWRKWSPCKHG